MGERMALCVGINRFAHLPQVNWLNGCVNDADDMGRALVDLFGFRSKEIVTLTDRQATKARVMDGLATMVQRASSGSVSHIVFSYSSHGTQLPDVNGDEPDRFDEAFAAYDIAKTDHGWNPATVIVDDELRSIFAQVPAEVLVEVYLDTCHSGSGLRAFENVPGTTPKFLPPPTRDFGDADSDEDDLAVGRLAAPVRAAPRTPGNQVLFSACRSDQTASDATFDRRPNGAFTYLMLQAMRATPDLTRAKLLTQLRRALKAGRYEQVPQLEAVKRNRTALPGAPLTTLK
jgi:hypothetical protein